MRNRAAFFIALSVAFLAGSTPLSIRATEVKRISHPQSLQPTQVNLSETDQKIRLARDLIRKKNFEAAAALLETVYEQNPTHPVAINLLFTCYSRLGYLLKAEELSRRLVEKNPKNFIYRLRLAEILARQSRPEEAQAEYNRTLALLKDNNVPSYRSVLQSMIAYGFEEAALKLIDTARKRSGDSTLFALDRGEILAKHNDYPHATQEFFAVLSDSGRTGSEAEKKILSFLYYPESAKEVERILLEKALKNVNLRAAKILSAYYLKTEQFDRAFDFAIMRDSLEGRTGTPLLLYLRSCQERELYPEVARMASYILKHYPSDHPVAGEAFFLYAEALAHQGKYAEAIKVYDSIYASFPFVKDKAEALYRIGDICLNNLNQPARALTYFDSVTTHYRSGYGYLNAQFAKPFCYLRMGKLPEAYDAFGTLLERRLDDQMKEAAEYYRALVLLFQKKYDSSKVAFRKLLVDYPRGYYVNDAIQMLLIFDEAGDAPELMYEYSNALFFEERKMPDSTAQKLLAVVNHTNKALADIALYKLILLELRQADSAHAKQYVDKLISDFPDSYYLPFGLKIKADMEALHPKELDHAKALYREILEKYPNYPFVTEVRKKLRQLEGEA